MPEPSPELLDRCARAARTGFCSFTAQTAEDRDEKWREVARAVLAEAASTPAPDEATGYVIGWRYRKTHGNPAREGWNGDWFETRERAEEEMAKWPGDEDHECAIFEVRAVLAEAASETEPRPPVPDQDGEDVLGVPKGGTWRAEITEDGSVLLHKAWDGGSAVLRWPADEVTRPSGPRVAPEPLTTLFREARSAVLYGMKGTSQLDADGVDKDEALEYAAAFIRAYEVHFGEPA